MNKKILNTKQIQPEKWFYLRHSFISVDKALSLWAKIANNKKKKRSKFFSFSATNIACMYKEWYKLSPNKIERWKCFCHCYCYCHCRWTLCNCACAHFNHSFIIIFFFQCWVCVTQSGFYYDFLKYIFYYRLCHFQFSHLYSYILIDDCQTLNTSVDYYMCVMWCDCSFKTIPILCILFSI